MTPEFQDYGLWWMVAINSLVVIVFAFSFARPKSPRDWRSFGAFSAFFVALFTEMYGFPLTIYLLSGWLTSRFPEVDWFAHDSGHLLEMTFGWRGNPHAGPFHTLSAVFILGGFVLLAVAWRVLYRAQRARTVAMSGPYALVRHPQYAAFVSIMFGFLLQWPTLPTLVMFPILVAMYMHLARREEREALAALGEDYRCYLERTPAFFPAFGNAMRLAIVVSVIFGLPSMIAYLAAPEPGTAVGGAQSAEATAQAGMGAFMGTELDWGRAQVENLKSQMRDLNGTTDPVSRRDLVAAHFDALRQIGDAMHTMSLKMSEDVDNGRIVSDTGLKQRLKLDAEIMGMQLDMLKAQTDAQNERGSDAPAMSSGAQQ